MKWQIQRFSLLDSSQTYLLEHWASLPEGTCIVAERQQKGYGREGRAWESAPGGLYFSLLLKPQQILPELPWCLWLSVFQALESFGLSLQLKAPNDILYRGDKCAGILIDSAIQGSAPLYYVLGVGVNVVQPCFPAGLQATSLHLMGRQDLTSEEVLQSILKHFHLHYQHILRGSEELQSLVYSLERRSVQIGYNEPTFITLKEYWHGFFRSGIA